MRTSKLLSTMLIVGMLAGCTSHKYQVYFKPGSSELTKESKTTVMRVVGDLKEHKYYKTKLYGFTDGIGSAELNKNLAVKRVAAVGDMLEKNGIADKRIKTDINSHKWIYAGEAKEDASQRRVDIRIYKCFWMK